jgi:hypothetical protein
MSTLVAAGVFATGYVLGAKAGRERYEEIRLAIARFTTDPHVQEVVTKVEDRALNLYNDRPSTHGSTPHRDGVAT